MISPFRNGELNIQFAAIDWLKRNWGYDEVKSGEEDDALGSPIDSLGTMDGRTLLVEVKRAVSGGTVRYKSNGSGSIEGKIARTLKGLHEGREDAIWPAIRRTWRPSRPPVFVLLAQTYTDGGLREAIDVLECRSSEWLFDYRIWQWTSAEVQEQARGQMNPSPRPEEYDVLRVPARIERSPRSPALSLQAHREEAERRGVRDLFDYTVRRAAELGYIANTTCSTVRLRAMAPDGLRSNAIGIYVQASSKGHGLNCGFYWKRSDIVEEQLAGRSAPKKGPLNIANRYIRTIEEAECVLELFAP